MLRKIFLALLLLAGISLAATPSYNASGQVSDVDNNSTATITGLAAAAGSNRFLEVWVCTGAGTPATHSSVTWGGASLTQRGASLNIGGFGRISQWYLKEANFPGGATGNVVATLGAAQDEVWLVAVIYQDVDQTNPFKNAALTTNTGASNNSATITVTSDANTLVTGAVWAVDPANIVRSIAATSGTSREEVDNFNTAGNEGGGASDIAGGASNATLSWTYTTSTDAVDDWGMVGDALQYSAGGGGGSTMSGRATLLGVGK